MSSEIRLFTRTAVTKAKLVVADPDAPADPVGGGGYADWAMLALHALRIELGNSYRVTIDLLSEMRGVLAEIGLSRLPHYSSFRDWFETIPMKTWRAFLDASVEKRSGHAAIDSTGFDRDQPSRHYVRRAHYHVRTLKVTVLMDVETLYITNVHSTRRRTRTSGWTHGSLVGTPPTCGASRPTEASTPNPSATNFERSAFGR